MNEQIFYDSETEANKRWVCAGQGACHTQLCRTGWRSEFVQISHIAGLPAAIFEKDEMT